MNDRRYVIALMDPRDQQTYYVGMTRDADRLRRQAPSRWAFSSRNPAKNEWIRDLLAHRLRPAVVVLEDTTPRRAPKLLRMWLERFRKWESPILNVDKAPKNREASIRLWQTREFWEKVHQGWERRRERLANAKTPNVTHPTPVAPTSPA